MARVTTSCTGAALAMLAIAGCMGGAAREAGREGAGGLLAPASSPAITGPVRMRAVALYRSGVGFFEQGGEVDGDATTTITVAMPQVDDVLKSLVAEDRTGSLTSVDYATPDPHGTGLASFMVDLTQDQPLASLLTSLRGETVSVRADGKPIDGAILGLDIRISSTAAGFPVPRPYLTLLTGATARQLPLDAISHLHFQDAHLAAELAKALAAIAARRGTHQSLALRWHGTGRRPVRVAFAAAAPLWKASYRLILPQATQGEHPARIQGWAVVENETDADWQGIQLDLMTGRPVSFIEHLADPRRAHRPVLQREREAVPVPDADRGTLSVATEGGAIERLRQRQDMQLKAMESQALAASDVPDFGGSGQGVEAEAQGASMGELYDYRVANPVSIARGHAAMLPFVTASLDCERVSICDADVLATHALTGALLTNTTGCPIPQGPLTVFSGGAYAGDASLGDVPAGEHRLISYAIDLPVRIQRTERTLGLVEQSCVISGGFLSMHCAHRMATTIDIDITDGQERTLIIEEPVNPNAPLIDTAKPFEVFNGRARWRVEAKPGRSSFTIARREILGEDEGTYPLGDAWVENIVGETSSGGALPASIATALRRAVALHRSIMAVERDLADLKARRDHLVEDQARLCADMDAARNRGPFAEHEADKLMQEDGTIDRIDARRGVLEAERAARRAAFDAYVAGLDLR